MNEGNLYARFSTILIMKQFEASYEETCGPPFVCRTHNDYVLLLKKKPGYLYVGGATFITIHTYKNTRNVSKWDEMKNT